MIITIGSVDALGNNEVIGKEEKLKVVDNKF
jgi:hypothetical protein